jgi:acetyltransferase
MGPEMSVPFPDDRPRISVTLREGSVALLSPLGPGDKYFLLEGLAGLSPESRYARFGEGRGDLTDAELEYLAAVDQTSHVAWGAAIDGEVAGVGRYIVDPERDCAEIAITVVDRLQRRGLGRVLFETLAAVARGDGVEDFCFSVHPDNEPVLRMLQGIDITLDPEGELVEGRIPLADIPTGAGEEAVREVMRQVRSQRSP